MRRLIGAGLLGIVFLTSPSLELNARQNKKDMSGKEAPPVDSNKLAGTFSGTLKTVPGTDRIFLVEVEIPMLVQTRAAQLVRNPTAARLVTQIIQLQRSVALNQQRLALAPNPQARGVAVQQLLGLRYRLQVTVNQLRAMGTARVLPAGYRLDVIRQEVEFQAAESVKVRSMLLPDGGFDDKGNPLKLNKTELDKLRGKDKNLPGFESSLEKLEVGQKIQVQLGPVGKKEKAKETDKETEPDEPEKKMQVKVMLITQEPTSDSRLLKGKR